MPNELYTAGGGRDEQILVSQEYTPLKSSQVDEAIVALRQCCAASMGEVGTL